MLNIFTHQKYMNKQRNAKVNRRMPTFTCLELCVIVEYIIQKENDKFLSSLRSKDSLGVRFLSLFQFQFLYIIHGPRGGAVVKVLRYKSEGRLFDSRWCHWNFSLT
jgi:hypothetical protein